MVVSPVVGLRDEGDTMWGEDGPCGISDEAEFENAIGQALCEARMRNWGSAAASCRRAERVALRAGVTLTVGAAGPPAAIWVDRGQGREPAKGIHPAKA